MIEDSSLNISDLIDPAMLLELKHIELRTKRTLDADLMGRYRSAFRGSGLVFSDLREYQPGDEIRNIHWKLTARTNKAFVKTYNEDRQLNIMLVVDVSSSTDFGSPRSKYLRGLEFAALISMLANKNQDCVGLSLFSDKVEEFYPPKKSRTQFQKIILSLLKHRRLQPSTNIKEALGHLCAHQKRASVVFLISDFYSAPFDHELKSLSVKHDVVCVLLEDKLDAALPKAGLVEFKDAEGRATHIFDTSNRRSREKLAKLHQERLQALHNLCRSAKADLIRISDNPLKPLLKLMQMRSARMR